MRLSSKPARKGERPKIPEGTLEEKWTKYRSTVHLVNPANKRSLEIIVN
jgi:hypothetical protein